MNKASILITVAGLALSITAGMTFSLVAPSTDAVLLVGLGLILTVPILIRVLARRFDPFEPLVIFAVAYGVMFLLRPTAMILNDEFVYFRPTMSIEVSSTFTEMLVLALIGAVGFVIGYGLPLGRHLAQKLRNPPERYHVDMVVSGAIMLAVIGILLFGLHLVQSGRTGSLEQLLSGRSSESRGVGYLVLGHFLLTPASLILISVGRAHRNLVVKLLATVSIAILLLRALPTGSRMTLLPFVGGLAVYHYASRLSRPRPAVVLMFSVIALTISMLLVETRVSGARQEQGINQIIVQNLKDPTNALVRLTESGDTNMAPGLAAMLTVIPEQFPHEYGGGLFGDLIVRPIPTVLWPNKPITPREEIIRALWPSEYAANIARPEFSILFHFYLEGGIAGVLLGMMTVGVLARGLYQYSRLHEANLVAQLLFGVSLMFIVVGMRDSPVSTLVRMSFNVLPIWAIFWVAAIRPRPARQFGRQ